MYLRTLPYLIALASLSVNQLHADPVPVTWNGSPTVTPPSCCTGGSTIGFYPSVTESQNGGEADVYEGFGTGVFAVGGGTGVASIDTPFTIASEATIELSLTADYGGYGTSCTPVRCNGTLPVDWADGFQGQFSGASEIVDSGGNVDLVVNFGGSGTGVPVYEVGEYVGQFDISSDGSGSVDLPAGNYSLLTFASNSTNSIGRNQMGVSVQESLVDPGSLLDGTSPVPEPSSLWLLVLCFGALLFFRKRIRV